MEAGITQASQLVDANAIVKILTTRLLFGLWQVILFNSILLSNLKLIGSKIKWLNYLFFGIGILLFDILVATMVAINTDEIKSLLVGEESQLKIWEVVKHGEFWLIFVFGTFPLIITHFIIEYIVNAYQNSQREIVDAEKNKQIEMLDKVLLDLNLQKNLLTNKINEKEELLKQKNGELESFEKELNFQQNNIDKNIMNCLKT